MPRPNGCTTKARVLIRSELGEQHPVYSTILNNRGFFYQTIGNAAAAEADYRRSLELKRTLFGPTVRRRSARSGTSRI
jgi:hypothetical protein